MTSPGAHRPRQWASSHSRAETGCSSRGRRPLSHEQAPARLSFHHLSPRFTRLGIDDRGISSSGVTVSQSIAALHGSLERKRPGADPRGFEARLDRARAARTPDRTGQATSAGRDGHRALERPALNVHRKRVLGVPFVELDLERGRPRAE